MQVGMGTCTMYGAIGMYALYEDRPCADTTPEGTISTVKEPKYPEFVYAGARAAVAAATAVASHVYLGKMNNFTSSGQDILEGAIRYRKPNQGLITVSNHRATVDDPAVLAWYVVGWSQSILFVHIWVILVCCLLP